MTIALTIVAVLAAAAVGWLVGRRHNRPATGALIRAAEPGSVSRDRRDTAATARVDSSRKARDDGSGLMTGIVVGSVLFGGDAQANERSGDSPGSHDDGSSTDDGGSIDDSGSIDDGGIDGGGSSDFGFTTDGEF